MGLFDFFKKTETKEETKISLRKNLVVDEVKRQNITAQRARVVFVLDHSGSMKSLYKNGTVQNLLERIFPLAMHFDDNSELEFYWFDNSYKELEPVTLDNLDDYVERVILSSKEHFGTTCYAPVMTEIYERYAVKNPLDIPTFVAFITDGNNSDKRATKEILITSSKHNIFWKYIGVGSEKFEFLEKLDDLKGRFIDNANFISVNNIEKITDEQLYAYLLTEYSDWLDSCRKAGIKVE